MENIFDNFSAAETFAKIMFHNVDTDVYIYEIRKLGDINRPKYIVSPNESIIITADSVAEIIKTYRK